jgi:hypothetical protein
VKKFYIILLITIAFIVSQYSCTKVDTTQLGSDLIPVVDNVNTFDTILNVETDLFELPDSTRIAPSVAHALGFVNDGSFGTTAACIYLSLSPVNGYNTHPFGIKDSVDNSDIDSVVLQLAYEATYGDTNSVINFQVEEIRSGTPNKFKDSLIAYRINTPKSFFGTGNPILGSINQNFSQLNDARKIVNKKSDTVVVSNVMRIPLNNSLGVRLKNYDSTSATNFAYKNDSSFREQFQGLGIVASAGGVPLNSGALGYFKLRDANTKLIVYYKSRKLVNPTGKDTLQATYGFLNFANANTLARTKQYNYATALASNITNEPEIHIQSSTGSYAAIKIPGLQNLSNRTIHRAELIIERIPGNDQNSFDKDYPFDTPPILFLDAVDSANKNRPTAIPFDFPLATNTALGYDAFSFGGIENRKKGYLFNLSRYVQGIVTRKEPSYTLRLYAPYYTQPFYKPANTQLNFFTSTYIGYGRVILGGGSNPDGAKKMRLRIIYSKI